MGLMRDAFPADAYVSHTIEQGAIYYFPEETFTSEEPHYFVTLNFAPEEDLSLVLASGTSQVEKAKLRRRSLPAETVVCVSQSECSFLKCETAFDCNSVTVKTIAQLTKKKEEGVLKYVGSCPEAVVTRLITGVLRSPLTEKWVKDLLRKHLPKAYEMHV